MSEARKFIAKKTLFQADKQIEQQDAVEENIATWEESIKYRNKWAVMDNSGEVPKEFSIGCDLSELQQFGPGLRLFFEFLKYSAFIFLVMALMSIPALVGNINGESLNSIQLSTNSLSKLSISNQPKMNFLIPPKGASASVVQSYKDANNVIIQNFVDKAGNRLLQVAIPDIVYSCVFLLFVAWFIFHSKKIENESKQTNVVPSRYAIEVTGFPSSVKDSKDISNHFREKFGADIFECYIAHNYYNTLFLHKEEARLIEAIKLEKSRAKTLNVKPSSKLTKLATQLQKIQNDILKQVANKLEGKNLSHSEYPSVKAFIIFNNHLDKLTIQREYNRIWSFLCFTSYPDKFKLFGKHKLKLSFHPDEPSNILWENVEVTPASRFSRTLLVLVLVLIVMLISFGVIILANLVKPTETSSCPSNTITYSEASTSTLYTKCYCMGLSFSEITSNSTVQNLCWDIWVQYTLTYVLTIVTGIVIMLVNVLLQVVIEALGKFNRYNTITKFSTSMTTKLFLAFFVNTALITLLMQANIYGFIPSVIATYPIYPLSHIQNNRKKEYSQDFDRDWYLSIGTKITITVFFFILTHICFQFFFAPIQRWLKERRVRKLIGKDIQRTANKNIIGPEFTITFYYGSALNIIFTCFFYSSGIPILLFTGFFILTILYWVYKYRLLRICRRPPSYDVGINKRILSILPWSLLLHLAIGIYMYGQPLIFPRSSSQLNLYMNYITTSSTTDYEVGVTVEENNVIISRAYNVLYLMILLFVVAAILAVYITFSSLQSFFGGLCKKRSTVIPISQSRLYNEEYTNIETKTIPSYNIKMNETYRMIIHAIDLGHKVDSELTPRRANEVTQRGESNFKDDKELTQQKNVADIINNI